MDKMQEIMNAIDNFNSLVEDVKCATETNKQIAHQNMKSALKFYVDKMQPYLDVAVKLNADIYCGRIPANIGEYHVRLLGKNNVVLIQADVYMFELKEDPESWGYLHSRNYNNDIVVPKVLKYLDDIFENGKFETDFYKKVNDIMTERMREANKEYQNSAQFVSLTER